MTVIRNLTFEEAARRLEAQEAARLALNGRDGRDPFEGDYDAAAETLRRLEPRRQHGPRNVFC